MKNSGIISIFIASIFFSFYTFGQPEISNIRQETDTVGLYDKLETRFDVDGDFANPFDPEEIDVSVTFTSPTGKTWKMFGFYNYSDWQTMWMVRFSPHEKGNWKYVINVRDRSGETTSETLSFNVEDSPYKGPMQIASNKRYLQYADGSPYFGVGLWYNDGYAAFNEGRIEAEVLDHLKDLGVNFISTFITPLETWGSGMGRYDQNICGRLDEVLEMCEDRDMLLSLNIWFHSYLSETVWGGGNSRWNSNPYQLVCDVKDFFSDEESWEYQEKLLRYFVARWGYSRSLGIWFIVDEVNGTDGWVSGDSLGAAAWGKKIHDYFKNNDPYNHPTTGTRSGGIREWWQEGYETFDLAGREIYEAQGFPIISDGNITSSETHPLTYSYRNYAGQVQKLWNNFDKPAIIPETGWDHTFYEMSMPGYLSQYHNALWVTMATGSAMSPFWWAYSNRLNDNVITNQLLYFRNFVDEIPVSGLTNVQPEKIENSDGDAYAMGSDQMIFGWVVNSKTDMANKTVTLPEVERGRYKLRIYHTWRGEFIEEKEIESSRNKISFDIPKMQIEGGHANYVGNDLAFILEKME
ncbi:MAG: DUF5060 domain-containing protein [Cyclobacteriaceae bacterium]|nr:DUF5060 domain-containing protein [Cyclobacteriaceae bacterium]